ncbi:hypothetical protein OLMES_0135 [Oleiphilus messinensis]|uniref:J domain-containing protein n=1 Tax=Oleiphilus messinensis TaxID=141451 RepID=A0A1Y0I4C9_9GAMM|nr:hypothetical protein [Oleiphilus messinensis]ARU54243.1 hypothetical protein OLMES_0135 [Oleiphilus messinensis]
MGIVVSQQSKKTNKKQIALNKLWRLVQNKRKSNERLELELDRLISAFHDRIIPVEKEILNPKRIVLLERLIVFFSRKSLANWHRDQLADWIKELLEQVAIVDAETAVKLSQEYNQVVANHMGLSVEEMMEEFEQQQSEFEQVMEQATEAAFEAQRQKDTNFHKNASEKPDCQPDMFGFDDLKEKCQGNSDSVEGGGDQEDYDARSMYDRFEHQEKLDSKWLRTMFRKIAQALHPDKEPDSERKDIKKEIMAKLLDARDQEDIVTIVELYSEHVVAGDFSVDDQDAGKLQRLLEQQLENIEFQREALITKSPLHEFVFDHFYENTKQKRESNLKRYIGEIREQAETTAEMAVMLRNLKNLKEVLTLRYDAARSRMFEDIDFHFDY